MGNEKVAYLCDAIYISHKQDNILQQDKVEKGDKSTTISTQLLLRLVELLQKTCQLVPEAQIVEDNIKYPIQKYRKGTAEEILSKAQKEVKLENVNEWTCDQVGAILRSHSICAWGGCYQKRKYH